MYISNNHKFAFVALPKNASRTVGVWLKNEYGAEAEDHHGIVPSDPSKIRGYFPFAIARNPFSRAVSRWFGWYQVMAADPKDLRFKRALLPSFEQYVGAMQDWHTADKRVEPGNALYHSCQCHVLEKAQKLFVDEIKVLRFESLHKELKGLPFVSGGITLPRRGVRKDVYGDWRRYYETPAVAEKVCEAYRADFDRLGYSAEPK